MKYGFLLIALLFSGCTKKENENADAAQINIPRAGVPNGAVREQFSDNPSMERITVRDQGILSAVGTLLHDKKEGSWVEFNANGTIKNAISYVNGEKEGMTIEMNPTGQVSRRISYHKNVMHGDYREYYFAATKEERAYVNGRLEGTVKVFYDNGKLMEEGSYKNGIRNGISRWYDQDGKLSIEYEYNNGALVKK